MAHEVGRNGQRHAKLTTQPEVAYRIGIAIVMIFFVWKMCGLCVIALEQAGMSFILVKTCVSLRGVRSICIRRYSQRLHFTSLHVDYMTTYHGHSHRQAARNSLSSAAGRPLLWRLCCKENDKTSCDRQASRCPKTFGFDHPHGQHIQQARRGHQGKALVCLVSGSRGDYQAPFSSSKIFDPFLLGRVPQ